MLGTGVSERTTYAAGAFCLVGLATSDPVAARSFYASLFDWEGEDLLAGAAGSFTMLRLGGKDVAALYRQTPEARAAGAPPHWTSYISVDAGRVAAIRDPTGAIVSLWQPRSRIGATLVNEVGALCWNELATTYVERAKSFFGTLLGWEYQTADSGYVSIKNAGTSNGGMREQTAQERGKEPSWLPYFKVEKVNATVSKAEQIGGCGLVRNAEVSIGPFAVIADPQGAAFAVLE